MRRAVVPRSTVPPRPVPSRTPSPLAWAVLLALPALACRQADATGGAVEVVDSAGVALVTSGADERPLTLTPRPDLTLGGKDDEVESFYEVSSSTVAAAPDGRIAVLDRDNHRVLVYDATGSHLLTLGGHGEGPGELSWPISVFWSGDGRVMVHDISKRTLVGWGEDGEPVEGLRLPETFMGGRVAPDGDGVLMTGTSLEPREDRLIRLGPGGDATTVARLAQPDGGPVELKSCGMAINGMTPLFTPSLRWATGGGLLALVDGTGYAVDLYREGALVRSVRRPVAPRPASAELAAAEVGDGMRVGTPAGERVCDAAEVAEQRGFADVVPAIRRVALAPDGTLWVERWEPGRDPGPVDLFDPEGRYQGTLPAGTALPLGFMPDGRVLWSETDEFDVERLVVGTLEWT